MKTKSIQRRPVLSMTVQFLNDFIQSSSLHPGQTLAPARELAAKANVSFVTMCKALRVLKSQGAISLTNRRRYAVVGTGSLTAVAPKLVSSSREPRRTPTERVAEMLRGDIRNTAFHPGAALPPMKELEKRYRTSFRTLRAACATLVGQGSIEKRPSGGFAVPFLSATGTWRSSIMCVSSSSDAVTLNFGQNDELAYRALELLCEQAHVEIKNLLVVMDRERQMERYFDKKLKKTVEIGSLSAMDDGFLLGFLLINHHRPGKYVDFERELRLFLANGNPVAILDETALLRLPDDLVKSPQVRVFSVAASQAPAAIVGRHLLAHGHRRIAFISPYHGHAWSQLRLRGLRDVYTGASVEDGVVPFVASPGESLWDDGVRRFGISELTKHYEEWRERIPVAVREDYNAEFNKVRFDASGRAEAHLLLLPLLESALADPGITAWVMVNDEIASMAHAFLKSKSIRIPADLSLVSFDDSSRALRDGFSSYNFNAPAVAAAILGFLLRRQPYVDVNETPVGVLVNRGSTGPARR